MTGAWRKSVIIKKGPRFVHVDCTEGNGRARVLNKGSSVAQACGLHTEPELPNLNWGVERGLVVKLSAHRAPTGTVVRGIVQEPVSGEKTVQTVEESSVGRLLERLDFACEPLLAKMETPSAW
jgi:hypothetical protein